MILVAIVNGALAVVDHVQVSTAGVHWNMRERLNWLIGELESEFISRQSFAGREEDYFIKARFNGKSASSLTESRTHNNGNGFVLVWLTDWAVKCGLAKS